MISLRTRLAVLLVVAHHGGRLALATDGERARPRRSRAGASLAPDRRPDPDDCRSRSARPVRRRTGPPRGTGRRRAAGPDGRPSCGAGRHEVRPPSPSSHGPGPVQIRSSPFRSKVVAGSRCPIRISRRRASSGGCCWLDGCHRRRYGGDCAVRRRAHDPPAGDARGRRCHGRGGRHPAGHGGGGAPARSARLRRRSTAFHRGSPNRWRAACGSWRLLDTTSARP